MHVAVWFILNLSKYSGASQIEHSVREYFLWSGGNERLLKENSVECKTIVIDVSHDPKPAVGWIHM